MDVTRVFDLQATFLDSPDAGETFSGTLAIDVTAGSVGRPPLIQHLKNFPIELQPQGHAIFILDQSSPGLSGTWQISFRDSFVAINLTLDTTTTLVGYRGGQVDGHVEIDNSGVPAPPVEVHFTASLTPSLSSPAGDLFLIADHDTTRTVIAPLQTSQVIAVVGSNVAFDGAGDFNNDGLSDLLAHTDAGGCEPYLLIK
jgi:hypothetical protein